MKKTFTFLLLALCLLCSSCENTETTTSEDTEAITTVRETTAIEALNEEEQLLFDALIKMTTADFYEPSKIRVLEIGDYSDNSKYAKDDILYGPSTVVVRLQGENRVGGTLNHYYKVCIIGAEVSETMKDYVENLKEYAQLQKILNGKDMSFDLLNYEGDPGDYEQQDDDFKLSSTSSAFDVGDINRALKEYWKDMGF
ncbi:MAG: hypothetical protein E7662_02070 [Ruminococcaceae bacterium]|nr:hypothetical protein [Oscillospiraceae bacterium]